MKLCLLSQVPSAAIHLQYYLQTQGLKFADLVMVAPDDDKSYVLKEYASVNGFGLHFVDDPNGVPCQEILKALAPDVLAIMISVVLRSPVLRIPRVATVNAHAGVLPRYRGLDCRRWALLEGGPVGVTAHLVNECLDDGPILAQRILEIRPGDTVASICERNYYTNKWQVMAEALNRICGGMGPLNPQPAEASRQYFRMHAKLAALVDRLLDERRKCCHSR